MPRDNFNDSQKTFIYSRQKGLCGSCGDDLSDEANMEYHHVLNCKDGGAAIVENGVMLCPVCHQHSHYNNFRASISVFRAEFEYANWVDNHYYRGRKKGEAVAFTKETLDEFDKIGTAMDNRSYEGHLAMITELKQTLNILQEYMESIKDKYKQQLDAMESTTFMDNYIQPLREKYNGFTEIIKTLQAMIDEHKRQISLHEEALENLIQDARS